MASESDNGMESDCSSLSLAQLLPARVTESAAESTSDTQKEHIQNPIGVTNKKSKLMIGAFVAIAVASLGTTLMGCLDVLGIGSYVVICIRSHDGLTCGLFVHRSLTGSFYDDDSSNLISVQSYTKDRECTFKLCKIEICLSHFESTSISQFEHHC